MGRFLKNNRGFTLVEVMIAAGIMGVMAVFFYKFFADQMKQQRTVMQRMDEYNIVNEIRLLLMNTDNCAETFKDKEVEKTKTDENVIDNLKKVYIKYEEGKTEPTKEVVEKYELYEKGKNEKKFGQSHIKINSYKIEVDNDGRKIINEFKRGEVELRVEFDRGKGTFGNQNKFYKIPLTVSVDGDNEITSCSSMGLPAGGEAGLVVLKLADNPKLSGVTGNVACKDKGLACAYVASTNFVGVASGVDSSQYTPACINSYNKGLQGVENGNGKSNIHTCEARIGIYETFSISVGTSSITCLGNFHAVCN